MSDRSRTPALPAPRPSPAAEGDVPPGEVRLTRQAIYPAIRQSASPSGGRPVAVNPPPLLWPPAGGEGVRYAVRLSQDPTFPTGRTITSTGQPWAVFNPHRKLAAGTWYWQYAVIGTGAPAWSPLHAFQVGDGARVFETCVAPELLAACPRAHPRLLVRADDLEAFRRRVRDLDAVAALVITARKRLGQEPPREEDAAPKRAGRDERQAHKLASDAGKELSQRALNGVALWCRAYLITGEEPFAREAVRWAVQVARWDRTGISGRNDLGDAFCLEAMALAFDSCYGLLTAADKGLLLQGIRARAGHFFSRWINRLEGALHLEHDWGHMLPRAVRAAVATLGDLAEAVQWLTYGYEVWLALGPSAGAADGGWMLGTNYNGIAGEALIAMPALFQGLTGVNFFADPFYRNNLYYLIYCLPPGSYGDGFGDAHELARGPRPFHLRYVEALGRRLGDPYATWYVEKSRPPGGRREAKKKELEWRELGGGAEAELPAWTGPFDLPQARAFREAGVVAMHTSLAEPAEDLFVGFRSSPWGSYGHAQADQNTFNVVVGGERLFYSSGYKMPITDPHMLGWYKHTRGHNGVLIDGKGQPFGSEAYGWIPRYLHGERITYCAGDASNAYDTTPVAEDAETLAGAKVPPELREGRAGLTRFRRHVLLLRPATVVVYDDLAADHAAEWSWLLHSMEEIRSEPDRQRLFASAAGARGQVDLRGSVPLRFGVTDRFAVPAVNWRGRAVGSEELDYEDNQWHFTAVSGRRVRVMRFLAVMQVRREGDAAEFTEAAPSPDGWMPADGWLVRAELDAAQKPYLEVRHTDGTVGLVLGQGQLTVGGIVHGARLPGSTLLVEQVAGRWAVQEAVDELPEAAR